MADAPISKERNMKFPYTLTAKMVNFPYKHYYKHAWLTRYWIAGLIVCVPIFYKITQAVNSPENVEKWRKIREAEYAGTHH
ncbi:uncharacterized protein LOC122854747 [Aphidius gifuensis]|nr:uncharacterized protein LOC122854747 [Aphidius gifuensis]